MKVQFLGAVGGVTGSRTLVSHGDTRLLLDCGMFQGYKENRLRNWDPLGVPPPDAVVLTHAHIDHSGWVPRLVHDGWKGKVYCTEATAALLKVLWPDAGRIQEEDAIHANRHRTSKHEPALPMYTEKDALDALEHVRPIPFHKPFDLGGIEVSFRVAGHILGASSVLLRAGGHSVLFSGDLGRPDDAVVPAPEPPPAVDTLVLESTYGNRLHPEVDRLDRLEEVILRTLDREGMVLVPTFAVGRAQGLLWSLHCLMEEGRIPRVPVVVDSPMATRATRAFLDHPRDLRLSPGDLRAMTRHVQFVGSVEESKVVGQRTDPFILLAASGMLTGGRVLHHLAGRGRVKRNTLLFVGFQAPGTRGARVLDGERTIRIFGNKVPIHCEVDEILGFSAHADAAQLHAWLSEAPARPSQILINHGEPEAADALRIRLQEDGYEAKVATEGVLWEIGTGKREVLPGAPPEAMARATAPRVAAPLGGALLTFRTDADATVGAIRRALIAMDEGALPSMPVLVQGPGLVARARDQLDPDELARVQLEG